MIKAYCYGVFADTMTDEEFYEVEKAQRECHAAWAENFSAVSELLEMNHIIDNADQLAAYPIAKGSVYKGNYSYPRRGEKFRLGIKFTSTAQAQKAMNALEDGTKTLKDFVNTFDTTPNLTRKQICECL